jgi:hypothetical protein
LKEQINMANSTGLGGGGEIGTMMKRNGKQGNTKGMEDSERKSERKKDRVTESLLPGLRHSKLFTGKPCKVRADTLLKLHRSQLRMITAVYTGHASVRGHLFTIGLFDGDPICRC